MADPRGEGAGGLCPPTHFYDFFFFFFSKTKFTSKKLYVVLNEYKIFLKKLEMATRIFKNLWGSMPPDRPRKLAPSALVVPPPPLKVLHLLEISHAQQFFNLGISVTKMLICRSHTLRKLYIYFFSDWQSESTKCKVPE